MARKKKMSKFDTWWKNRGEKISSALSTNSMILEATNASGSKASYSEIYNSGALQKASNIKEVCRIAYEYTRD